jgi:uncharacterized protein
MEGRDLSRRDFVKVGAASTAALLLSPDLVGAGTPARPPAPPAMPSRPLGRTGHQVKLFSLGGEATLDKAGREDDAAAIINRALDLGVNYIDTAPAYGQGTSLRHIGEVMRTRRAEVYLASKTHARTRDQSMRLLDMNLELLQTDHLDLWQLHNVTDAAQVEQLFAPGGALEALIEAREQGLVRHLGVTGHFDPAPLLTCIERFDFDTILVALNPADRHVTPFTTELLPRANAKGMGIIGMKLAARGRVFRSGGIRTMEETMRYTLSLPISTVIVGVDDVAQVEENVRIATAFQPLDEAGMARLEALVAPYAGDAMFFKRGGAGWG